MADLLEFRTCADLPQVPSSKRREIQTGPTAGAEHTRLFGKLDVFHRLEVRPPPKPKTLDHDKIRVAFWNVERGRRPKELAGLLSGLYANAALLCELDIGMARSGQIHAARELADYLQTGYAFGVEFLELGLGDELERTQNEGVENLHGLHGAAILSATNLISPAVLRLESDGHWFDGSRGERRVGGRIAMLATLPVAGQEIVLGSVHFESHTGPVRRAEQMRVLIDGLDSYADGRPVLIGGDFNTKSMPRDEGRDPQRMAELLAEAPNRLADPVPFEPLFEVASEAGFEWTACNTHGFTTRNWRHDPSRPLAKLDWFFCRGLAASEPAIHAAIDANDNAVSDHEILSVSVSIDRGPA